MLLPPLTPMITRHSVYAARKYIYHIEQVYFGTQIDTSNCYTRITNQSEFESIMRNINFMKMYDLIHLQLVNKLKYSQIEVMALLGNLSTK